MSKEKEQYMQVKPTETLEQNRCQVCQSMSLYTARMPGRTWIQCYECGNVVMDIQEVEDQKE